MDIPTNSIIMNKLFKNNFILFYRLWAKFQL